MTNLYIKVVNGQPVDHPSFEDNLIQAFGSVPAEYQPFTRIAQPSDAIGVFQKRETSYGQVDGTWQDVWTVVDMSAEEKTAILDTARANQPYPSWTFNESNATWNAPTARPETAPAEGKYYKWDEPTLAWVEATFELPTPPVAP